MMIERNGWFPRVLLALALVAGACGGSNGASPPTVTPSTPVSSTTLPSTTVEAPPTSAVFVYYSSTDPVDCGDVERFTRSVADGPGVVLATFEALVAGPTEDEITAGVSSFFSAETATVVQSVDQEGSLLIVDFSDLRPLMPNASSSCGSEALLAQLNSTAFQFDAVQRVRYQIQGSCEAFGNWLQRDCFEVDRSGEVADVVDEEASR